MGHINQLTELKLEILAQCPLNCIHCSSESTSACREIVDPAMIATLVKEFVSLGGNQIQISGGEPLEHPELIKILDIIREENLTAILYTSGLRWNGSLSVIDSDLATMLKRRLRSAVFSFHGGNKVVHDTFTRTPGSFESSLESLATCQRAGIDVAVHFVPTQANYESLPELVGRLKRQKIKRISLLRFVPHGRGAAGSLALTSTQLRKLREMVEQLSDEGVYIRLGSPFSIFQNVDVPRCQAGIDRMLVSPDGTAYPCDAFKGFRFSDQYQNVYKDGLERVWTRSSFFKIIRKVEQRLPSDCRGCSHEDSCHGGCPAQRAFEYTSLDDRAHRDPCCLGYPALFQLADSGSAVNAR